MNSSRFVFRTEVKVNLYPFRLNYETPVLFCGSCFAENIGGIMQSYKMPVLVNPNGVVYNPLSVAKVISNVLHGREYSEADLNHRNGVWFSFDHYTRFSSASKDDCLLKINAVSRKANDFIKNAKIIAITFGTARVYRLLPTEQVVANCHKIPAKEFIHTLLTVDEIVSEWSKLMDDILSEFPAMRFLFTVSPIRHWKDGAIGNQLSKAILTVAVHKLISLYPNVAYYFPGYEIMMDDLRDYRFYDTDMLHLSQLAVDYIWQKFSDVLIDGQSLLIAEQVHKIQQALSHRPVNPNSEEFKRFVEITISQIENLIVKYPFLNFDEEMNNLKEYKE